MIRKMLLTLGLLAVFVLSACTPSDSAPTAVPENGVVEEPAAPPAEAPTAVPAAATEAPAEGETAAEQPMAVPTSRGSQLVATDPNTVNLTSGEPQLIEFFAFWWGTCQNMAPVVHGLEAQYYSQIQFSFLDIDDSAVEPFKAQFGFRSQPMFVLLDANGTPVKTWFGAVSTEEFATEFAKVLQ